MHRAQTIGFVIALAGLAPPQSMSAASTEPPVYHSTRISFSASIANSYPTIAVPRAGTDWNKRRLYEEPEQIAVDVSVAFTGQYDQVTVYPELFAKRVAIVVRDEHDRTLPTRKTGRFSRAPSQGHPALEANVPNYLGDEDGNGMAAHFIVTRADGHPFKSGRYVITLSLRRAIKTMRFEDGSVPMAEPPEQSWALEVRPPQDSGERSRMDEMTAERAMRDRRFADAAAAAQKAVAENDANTGAYTVLTYALMRLGRCDEAAAALERVVPFMLSARTAVARLLAEAYVCADDEGNARRALRTIGYQGARLDEEIRRSKLTVQLYRGSVRR